MSKSGNRRQDRCGRANHEGNGYQSRDNKKVERIGVDMVHKIKTILL